MPTSWPRTAVRHGVAAGAVANALLIGVGWLVFPTTAAHPASWLGLTADLAVLAAYAAAGRWAAPAADRRDPRILPAAAALGGLAGAVFGTEVALEYVLLPEDNTAYGCAEFGTVLGLYLLAGFAVARRAGAVAPGVLAAVWAAVVGSTVWLGCVLSVSYLFHGTPRQARVFRAEGNDDDFRRSGMADFDAFIMQDFMGAAFFHLLLGPAVAAVTGAAGAAAGAGLTRWRGGRAWEAPP
jgi:hypothetical protein